MLCYIRQAVVTDIKVINGTSLTIQFKQIQYVSRVRDMYDVVWKTSSYLG